MNLRSIEPYDIQPEEYADFANKSFSWLHIEMPALDKTLANYYERGQESRVLDVGCGSGRVISHLIKRGIPAENITGIDSSVGQLGVAARELPQEVGLVKGKAIEMPFNKDSFHLVVANMVLHAMNDQEVEATIEKISNVLVPGGEFFFIDTNPDATPSARKPSRVRAPWGMILDVFNHDTDVLLNKVAPKYGLHPISSELLEIDEAGRSADPKEYARYSAGHFRLAALLRKSVE